jgi:transcriptional regulator with XRE-family HTH domain
MDREKHREQYGRFLEKLKKAREEAGLTQIQAAQAVCKHQSFTSKIESGERRIDFVELQELAHLYKKPLSFFED